MIGKGGSKVCNCLHSETIKQLISRTRGIFLAKVNELAKMYFKNTAVLENILVVMNDLEKKLSAKIVSENGNATSVETSTAPLMKEPLREI